MGTLRDQLAKVKEQGLAFRMAARGIEIIYEVAKTRERFCFFAVVGGVDEAGEWTSGGFEFSGSLEARWPKDNIAPTMGDFVLPASCKDRVYRVHSVVRHPNAVEWRVGLEPG